MSTVKTYMSSLVRVLKSTYNDFFEFKTLKLSASLAFITVFSIAPLIVVVVYVFNFIYSQQVIESFILSMLKDYIGNENILAFQRMIRNATITTDSYFNASVGIISLVFAATSVFAEIQDSINTIWGLRPKKQSGYWLFIKNRLLSFGVIGSLGFILLVATGFSTLLDVFLDELSQNLPFGVNFLITVVNFLLTFLITVLLFGSIFTILPDAKIKWNQVRLASISTSLLFLLGKYLISYYISSSKLPTIFGAASYIVIFMLWVYYSSIILYLGAIFSKNYANVFSQTIVPENYAEEVKNVAVTKDEKVVKK